MPLTIADDNVLRLSTYGYAYKETITTYKDYVIVDIEERFSTNTQNETRILNLIIDFKQEKELN